MTFSIKEGLILIGAGVVAITGVVYAWQREQDATIHKLDKIIDRNVVLIEQQEKLNNSFKDSFYKIAEKNEPRLISGSGDKLFKSEDIDYKQLYYKILYERELKKDITENRSSP